MTGWQVVAVFAAWAVIVGMIWAVFAGAERAQRRQTVTRGRA